MPFFKELYRKIRDVFAPPRLGADLISPPRDIIFLVDHSLAPLRETISRASYEFTIVDPSRSQLEVLNDASSTNKMLLTTNQTYLNIANRDNNKFGILILPANFGQGNPNTDHLYDLLNDYYEDIRKTKLYPVGVCVASMANNTWSLEKREMNE